MWHAVVVYAHLIFTCVALGIVISTDLRLVGKLLGYRVVIAPPDHIETRLIALALAGLCLTGAALIVSGLDANPKYLSNPKLLAKIVLVGVLIVNAVLLHRVTFPRLAQGRPVASWRGKDKLKVAVPVGVSNSLWLFCAFLGVARPWNNTVPMAYVLSVGLGVMVLGALMVWLGLWVGAHDLPRARPDWVDSLKAKLSDHAPLGEYRHSFDEAAMANAADRRARVAAEPLRAATPAAERRRADRRHAA
jgi:uncharacterized membrane protein